MFVICRVAAALLALAAPARAWMTTVDVGRPDAPDGLRAVSVGADGDAIVVGTIGCAFMVARLTGATAATSWEWRSGSIVGCIGEPPDAPIRVALHDGDALAIVLSGGVLVIDVVTGQERWRVPLGADWEDAFARAVAFDAEGNVVVAGGQANWGEGHVPGLVASFDGATGALRWRQTIAGTAPPETCDDYYGWCEPQPASDVADVVVIDPAGDLVVAGTTWHRSARLTVVKLSAATGEERWRTLGAGRSAHALAVDAAGNPVVAGPALSGEVLVSKFASDGAPTWTAPLAGAPAPSRAAGHPMLALLGGGDVVVATGDDVTRLDGTDGGVRWRRVHGLQGPSPFWAESFQPPALVVDASGVVVVAGAAASPSTDLDVAAHGIDPDSGAERWRFDLDGTGHAADRTLALAAAPGGGTIIGGYTTNVDTRADATAVSLDGSAGTLRWRRDLVGVRTGTADAYEVTTTSEGDVIAAGSAYDGRRTGPVLALFDGRGGAQGWWRAVQAESGRAAAAAGGGAIVESNRKIDAFGQRYEQTVMKVDTGDGADVWRTTVGSQLVGYGPQPGPLTLAGSGDVVYASHLEPTLVAVEMVDGAGGARRWQVLRGVPFWSTIAVVPATNGDVFFFVADDRSVERLDAATGARRWRVTLGESGQYGYGTVRNVPGGGIVVAIPGAVLMLDGTTGAETWRLPTTVGSVEVDPAGDLLAVLAHYSGEELMAAKLGARDGVEQWRTKIVDEGDGSAPIVVTDAAGDMIVATRRRTSERTWTPIVVKLDGRDGRMVWTWTLASASPGRLSGVTVDAEGDVVIGGGIENRLGGTDLLVAKLDGVTGTKQLPQVARRCRRAVVRAASSAFARRLRALQRGDSGRGATRELEGAGARARALVAASCTDELVSAFPMCATTVDGLVSPAGTGGCMLEQVDLAVTAAAGVAPPTRRNGGACRSAITSASGRFARTLSTLASTCRDRIDRGTLIALPDECFEADAAIRPRVDAARDALRTRLEGACDAAALRSAGACASSLDGLAVAGADAGCLVVAQRDAVAALLSGVLGQ